MGSDFWVVASMKQVKNDYGQSKTTHFSVVESALVLVGYEYKHISVLF